jgi:hypothetical protein
MKMNPSTTFDEFLIAPCGINCGTCYAYLRDKNKCQGCRDNSINKPKTRNLCKIKNCEVRDQIPSGFCYDCNEFPCPRLEHIDKRYRFKYKTSLIQNLLNIKEIGMTDYLNKEIIRWSCPNCGSTISVHKEFCLTCNIDLNKIA